MHKKAISFHASEKLEPEEKAAKSLKQSRQLALKLEQL